MTPRPLPLVAILLVLFVLTPTAGQAPWPPALAGTTGFGASSAGTGSGPLPPAGPGGPTDGARANGERDLELKVVEHTLANGMQFLIVERHDAPTVSAFLRFKVGSGDEGPGSTGLAHLLEHMMFKGTRLFGTADPGAELPLLDRIDALYAELQAEEARAGNPAVRQGRIPLGAPGPPDNAARIETLRREIALLEEQAKRYVVKNEYWEVYRRQGGTRLNATTGRDGTQYFVSLPRNRLEVWFLLESDRMQDPVFREFYTEREVVHEERRQSIENRPEGRLFEALFATAFVALPYRHPIIGWPQDIDALTRAQARRFFLTYYAPNNAVAVLVGDLDAREAIRMAERHFGPLPARPLPLPLATREPEAAGERRATIEMDAEPQVLIGYRLPPYGHPDSPALSVLGSILSDGRSSRFHRALVDGRRLAASVSGGPIQMRYGGLFAIRAVPRSPHTAAELEQAVYEELYRLRREPPTERELQKVRNQLDAAAIRSLASHAGLASQLGSVHGLVGDWRYILESRKQVKAVTAEQAVEVLDRYFAPRNRTVITLVKSSR